MIKTHRSFIGAIKKTFSKKKASLDYFQTIFDKCPLPICLTNVNDGRFIATNDAFLEFAKCDKKAIIGQSSVSIGLWKSVESRADLVEKVCEDDDRITKLVVSSNFGGETTYTFEIYSSPIIIDYEHMILSSITDITELKKKEALAAQNENQFKELSDAIGECYFACDINGRFIRCNSALCMLLGYSKSELIGKSIDMVLSSSAYRRDIDDFLTQFSNFSYPKTIEQEWICKNKTAAQIDITLFIESGPNAEAKGFWGLAKESVAKLDVRALNSYGEYHDLLTKLPNRVWVADRLQRMIRRARIVEEKIALLFIDFKSFKLINDAQGYRFGDLTLKEAAKLIEQTLRSTDLFARVGGDEFAIVVSSSPIERSALSVLRRLLELFKEPITIVEKKIELKAHIGISVFPDDSSDYNLLISNAESAAKKASENDESFVFNSPELDAKSRERLDLEKALVDSLSSNAISVCYQPINDFSNDGASATIALEACARWRHSKMGELTPNSFIDIASEIGVIGDIDRKVFEIALNDLLAWSKKGLSVKITVNLAQKTLEDATFANWAIALVKNKKIDPKSIAFDVLYADLLIESEAAKNAILDLSLAGFGICADDFGAELVFLSKLKKLGVKTIKVAPKRLRTLGDEDKSLYSLALVGNVAKTLGLELTVVGVENETLDRKVNEAGAMIRQGFFYSKPMDAKNIAEYIKRLKK
ncbi:MAG: EAL domain-containing protein [Helicobacteraceae bacterium]|jgi:diguanylate cyclase (GGDEF)-like protein/PAS domain S-box-containing protein|nr:EAL domain-containing protein [Helicobacteraceae bacterium]